MFWDSELALPSTKTNLETLLDADQISLDDILEDTLTLQEIRNGHEKLLDYLAMADTLQQLLKGALLPEIDDKSSHKEKYRRAYQCTEVLSLASNKMCTSMLGDESTSKILSDFLCHSKLNHLLVSFYTKIITHLLNRKCEALLEKLRQSDFFSLCLKNMRFSAVADLLYQITSVPKEFGTQEYVRQWYAENFFGERLCELLSPEENTFVHGNVTYLWCELLTTLREYQYQFPDDKMSDTILDSLQSEKIVFKLLELMLPDTPERRNESTIKHGSAILVALLETNYIPDRPSFILGLDERFEQSHFGTEHAIGGGEYDVWLPDSGRVVESCVASYVDRLVITILDSLEVLDTVSELPNDSWFHLMQVFVQLLNTNCIATHEKIVKIFTLMHVNPFQRLLSQVTSHPLLSLYQVYLERCIKFILNSIPSPTPSPLISYLLEESNLLGWIVSVYEDSLCERLKPLSKKALRGFSLSLALAVHQTRIGSASANYIEKIINASEHSTDWNVLINVAATKYEDENACTEPALIEAREAMHGPVSIDDEAVEAAVVANKVGPDFEGTITVLERRSDSPLDFDSDITNSLNKLLSDDDEKFEQEIEEMRQLGFDTSLVTKEQEEQREASESRGKVRRVALKLQRTAPCEDHEATEKSVHEVPRLSSAKKSSPKSMIDNGTSRVLTLNSGEGDNAFTENLKTDNYYNDERFDVPDWPTTSNSESIDSSDWPDFTSKKADDWPPLQSSDDTSWPGASDDTYWPGASDSNASWPGSVNESISSSFEVVFPETKAAKKG